MKIWDQIQSLNVTPTVKAAFIQAFVTIFVFLLGLFFGSNLNKAGRFQMFHGISTVGISDNGSMRYDKEENVFLIDTHTGSVRKYAHDSVNLGGKTMVYEGWNHELQPIGSQK